MCVWGWLCGTYPLRKPPIEMMRVNHVYFGGWMSRWILLGLLRLEVEAMLKAAVEKTVRLGDCGWLMKSRVTFSL